MDFRDFGIQAAPLISTLNDLFDFADDHEKPAAQSNPSKAYVRDARAMAATPADVKECPDSYEFVVDMPGVGAGEVKVQVEDGNVLVVTGDRKREKKKEEEEGVKFLKMERRMGKFMRRFPLPENADADGVSAVCRDGVLVVTVKKRPPPEPKAPRNIEVKIGGN